LSGPTAPNLTIQELNNQLILSWTNPTVATATNNVNENYSEDYDKSSGADSLYRFEGYMLYQLKDETVSPADFYNPDKARLVLQCDKANGVKQIVNFTYDLSLQALVPQEMVNGADKGIVHSIAITEDKFAVGDAHLINHKTYYYAIIAYGYSPTLVTPNYAIPKDYLPFIAGNKTADGASFVHSGIPHNPAPENGGTEAHGNYGEGPKLTRIEGHGNGGNVLDLTSSSVSDILSAGYVKNPVYENSRGPVTIKVVDPLSVPDDNNFKISMNAKYTSTGGSAFIPQDSSTWTLTNLTTSEVVNSDKTIAIPNEQIINGQPTGTTSASIPKWGISVNWVYTTDPGTTTSVNNGFLEGTMTFSDNTKQWLTGMPDEEGPVDANWIRSGAATFTAPDNIYNDAAGLDANQNYENIINKTWAPYRLCATGTVAAITPTLVYAKGAPAWPTNIALNKLSNLASVNVVITSDKSLWTRCPVLEEEDDATLAVGGAKKLHMRAQASVDKNGSTASGPDNSDYPMGMGWFPGYAINEETGERLNMAFGEDSWLVTDHGADMIWNPTGTTYATTGDPSFGGKHYIYVFGHNADAKFAGTDPLLAGKLKDIPRYDKGATLHDILEAAANGTITSAQSDAYKREVYTDAMWVNIPLLSPGHNLFETDVVVRLRVAKSYQKGYSSFYVSGGVSSSPDTAVSPVNRNYPQYTFSTADIATHTNQADIAKNSLDLINVVPNPYYAYSSYEKTALSNIVKITNLPQKCDISIFTLNGTLIRKFSKDDTKNSLDWDLKNSARIPIASGMYIIYVKVPDVGEKTLKWFGVLRPIDLDSY
jgi:hypothetical protein